MTLLPGGRDQQISGEPLYFGCWQRTGHGFFAVGMRSANYGHRPPTPWGWGVEELTPPDKTGQGASALHHKDGWTALAMHDYTVDRRGNSKSVFCFPEILDGETALQRAREIFPEVIARLESVAARGSATEETR